MTWALRFHGVGGAGAVELGSAMASIECDGRPWLTIDCGGEGLRARGHRVARAGECLGLEAPSACAFASRVLARGPSGPQSQEDATDATVAASVLMHSS